MIRFASAAAAAALIAVAAAAPAAAQKKDDWVRVGSHVDRSAVDVDAMSITASQGLRRAWWRMRLAEPRRDGAISELHHELVDCRQGLTSTLGVTTLAGDGTIISDVREPESVALDRLTPVTPSTTGEMVAQAICRMPIYKPPVAKRKR